MTKFWNPNLLLSYPGMLYFVNGGRAIGKSSAIKKYVLNRYLKHNGEQFMYLRQNKNQIDDMNDFLGDLDSFYPEVKEFKQKSDGIFAEKERVGYFFSLREWYKIKSQDYPKVTTIILDEYSDAVRWGEGHEKAWCLLNIMDTILRHRDDVKTICLGNSTDREVNDYFKFFNILPNPDKRFTNFKSRGIVIENITDESFYEDRKKSSFGRLIDGTDYAKMSLENRYGDEDDRENLVKHPSTSRPLICISCEPYTITGYYDKQTDAMYFKDEEVNISNKITIDPEKTGAMNFYKYRKQEYAPILQNTVNEGRIFYEDLITREKAIPVLQRAGIL